MASIFILHEQDNICDEFELPPRQLEGLLWCVWECLQGKVCRVFETRNGLVTECFLIGRVMDFLKQNKTENQQQQKSKNKYTWTVWPFQRNLNKFQQILGVDAVKKDTVYNQVLLLMFCLNTVSSAPKSLSMSIINLKQMHGSIDCIVVVVFVFLSPISTSVKPFHPNFLLVIRKALDFYLVLFPFWFMTKCGQKWFCFRESLGKCYEKNLLQHLKSVLPGDLDYWNKKRTVA